MGAYATDRFQHKNPLHGRVLYPTKDKLSFLERNKFMKDAILE